MSFEEFSVEIMLPDIAATREFATRFAPLLKRGDVVAFDGALGTGKTEFCRAIIHALGLADEVPSPTFTLVQIYESAPDDHITPPVWHMDMYRLERPEEALELGIDEAFDTAVSLIEWPAKLGSYLSAGFLTFRLEIAVDGRTRKLTITGGHAWKARLGKILSDE